MKCEARGGWSCNGTREATAFVRVRFPGVPGLFAICPKCVKLEFVGKAEVVSLEDGMQEWTIEKVHET